MDTTQQGMDRVASLEFAKELRAFIYEWRRTGRSDEEGQHMMLALVAFTLMDKTPNEVAPREFQCFVDEHVVEINQVIDRALATLMCHDVEGTTVQ